MANRSDRGAANWLDWGAANGSDWGAASGSDWVPAASLVCEASVPVPVSASSRWGYQGCLYRPRLLLKNPSIRAERLDFTLDFRKCWGLVLACVRLVLAAFSFNCLFSYHVFKSSSMSRNVPSIFFYFPIHVLNSPSMLAGF